MSKNAFQPTQPSGDPAFADTVPASHDAGYPEPPFVVSINQPPPSPQPATPGEPVDWHRVATAAAAAAAASFALVVLVASTVP